MPSSIHKACAILRLLDGAGGAGLRLADLARLADLSVPTAHRILGALREAGFALQEDGTRRYLLGPGACALGHPAPRREALCQAGTAALRALRDEVQETVTLAMHADGRRCVLRAFEGEQPLRVVPAVGEDLSFYETSTGRALLAEMPSAELSPLLRRLGWPGRRWAGVFTDRDLAREFQGIRTTGLAVAEQRDVGVTSLAAPLGIPGLPAAVGLDYPASRDSGGRRQTLGARLRQAAERIRATFLDGEPGSPPVKSTNERLHSAPDGG